MTDICKIFVDSNHTSNSYLDKAQEDAGQKDEEDESQSEEDIEGHDFIEEIQNQFALTKHQVEDSLIIFDFWFLLSTQSLIKTKILALLFNKVEALIKLKEFKGLVKLGGSTNKISHLQECDIGQLFEQLYAFITKVNNK